MKPQPDTQQLNKKKLDEQKAAAEKAAAEKKAARDQQLAVEAAEALKQADAHNEDEEKRDMTEMVTYKAKKSINPTDWELLLKDYEAAFNRKPGKDNTLTFDSPKEAKEFFTKQAEKNRQFMCAEINDDGSLTGHYMISCGTGKLYEGKLKDIKKEMEKDKEANPDQKAKYDTLLKHIGTELMKQATSTMRDQEKQAKQEEPKEEETEEERKRKGANMG